MSVISPRRSQYQRPQSSSNMSDLHVYIVPPELWEERQNLAFNQIISETISAGFVRINAETLIVDLRIEIDLQLGNEVIPKDYVFCKSVGRCLAQVREKQENFLKVKHFLPPNSYCPEVFIVDSVIAKRNQTATGSSKFSNSNSERNHKIEPYPYYRGPELRTGRANFTQNYESEEIDDHFEEQPQEDDYEDRKQQEIEKRRLEKHYDDEEKINRNKRKSKIEMLTFNSDNELSNRSLKNEKDETDEYHNNNNNNNSISDLKMNSRRKEIDGLQREIMKRYEELDNLEREHERKLIEWEADEEKRKKEEIERRKMFEQMEMERRKQEEAIIAKQKLELKKLEELLVSKQQEIVESEEKLLEEKENRKKIMETKQREIEELKDAVAKDSNPDQSFNDVLINLQKEIEEMERKQNELIEATMEERKAAENDFKRAQVEFENLKAHWEEERKEREKQYADRMAEEERLRVLSDQKRLEHERRMEEERKRMVEERDRFEEEQKHWEEERLRYEEEEKRRMEEMELAIQEAYNNKPAVPKFEIKDPELLLVGATDVEQINHLKKILKSSINDREYAESYRENVLKKIRTSQLLVQSKRNQIRDFWKKRYFDEKKKTPPLEEQMNRYKEEIELLHNKLMGYIESGLREHQRFQKRNGIMSPSNKANLILQATRIQHEIEDLHRQIEHCQMRLSAEIKLKAQTQIELKVLRIEAMQKKIRLSRTRSDQLAIMAAGHNSVAHSYQYTTPRNTINIDASSNNNRLMEN